jgi:hypothetical protein
MASSDAFGEWVAPKKPGKKFQKKIGVCVCVYQTPFLRKENCSKKF